ncbi:cobyrinic acid a,c-diamide synthase [Lyngbya sp. CCY1209]|uniref:cobyrinic acid a,c-diamide synthase n=1 Tax=Lyngbya sp. CCY1209 TaxID=2886103 RepID=UPI002D20A2F1|nr:cobyrinic acid a,c-diamide synthase [Lyngbya sp. CCY1209]MEB3885284.1 cobyrinic acid a,c-diamide synthase [Lyngbya sp. CCY1209]
MQPEPSADLLTPLKNNVLFEQLPPEVQHWAESLPWNQRRYVLSLCYIICASPPEKQAEFLDDYTADGLVSKLLEDIDSINRIRRYFKWFKISTPLTEAVLRKYIRQFYIHSAQDARCQPDIYLESALKLVLSPDEKDRVFNYIVGFELIKLIFKMSWLQHERLSRLQKSQDEFIKKYIKPIQHAHRINGLIVPKDEKVFFAKRDYYVQQPDIGPQKLLALIMATFTSDRIVHCGFSVTRHIHALEFDYDYIFNASEPESIFPWESGSVLGSG